MVLFPGTNNNPAFNNQLLDQFNAMQIIGMDSTKQDISGIDFETGIESVDKLKEIFSEISLAKHIKNVKKIIRIFYIRYKLFQNGVFLLFH